MKIVEIKEFGDSIYIVRFKPNWFKRIFGSVEWGYYYLYLKIDICIMIIHHQLGAPSVGSY
jgi:hypothetical protein